MRKKWEMENGKMGESLYRRTPIPNQLLQDWGQKWQMEKWKSGKSRVTPQEKIVAQMLALLASAAAAASNGTVTCETINIPALKAPLERYRSAVLCYPTPSSDAQTKYPLHLLAHGDLGGGGALTTYLPLQKQIAEFGFVVAAWASCSADSLCDNGAASFMEAIKTLQFLEQNPTKVPIDFNSAYSASGHSTGARVVLMLAAIVDSPGYLSDTKYAVDLTKDVRTSLSKIRAVVADHADPMYDPKQNPDIPEWNVTKMPVMIITGTNDRLEPLMSGWKDFSMLQTPNKVFVNIANATHLQPIENHHEGPYLSFFSQYFALSNTTAGDMIYGDVPGSLESRSHTHFTAMPGERNTGDGKVGFVACSSSRPAMPLQYASYCNSPMR
jgi:hypothetical protein